MNLTKLKVAIIDRGVRRNALADALGVSRSTIYSKLDGKREFTVGEALRMSEFLRLSREERDEIFFS